MKTPYTTTRRVRNRYLVRVRDRRRLRELARVAVAVLLVGAALLGYTWLHLRLLEGGYRVEQLQGRLHELERLERHLHLEAAYLASPQRIEDRAIRDLGMTRPSPDQMIFVTGDEP